MESNTLYSLENPNEPLVWIGAKLGLKTGLGLSIAYALLGVFIAEFSDSGIDGVSIAIFILIFGSPIIFLQAIIPAVIYGIATGAIIGIIANRVTGHVTKIVFVLASTLVYLTIVILSHYLLGIQAAISLEPMSPSRFFGVYESYLFCFGIPSIVYILAGVCVSWWFYDSQQLSTNR